MVALDRVRIPWSGGKAVGPSVSTFYWTTGNVDHTALVALFTALAAIVPTGNSWTVSGSGDTIESTTGALLSGWTTGADSVVNCTGGTEYWAGVGARIVWNTNGIHHGRRVRGSTFIVPLAEQFADSGGTIQTDALNAMITAAAAFVTAAGGDQVVWSRPGAINDGAASAVVSSSVPDKVSWLRSRRV